MIRSVSGKLFLLFSMVFLAFSLKAQKVHFIYLQTEGGQPFYAKFNNKLISSSSEGYIIIPSVTDGVYNLVVGFPRNEFPEEDYTIAVDNMNEGYLLKNLGEKGWELFDMQTLALIKGSDNKPAPVIVKKDEDPFTKMLAGVVKDSSILQNHDTMSVATAKTADTSIKINVDTSSMANKAQGGWKIYPPLSALDSTSKKNELTSSVGVASPSSTMKKDSAITQILKESDKDGVVMIYEVKDDSSITDTISIFMPIQKNQADSSNANHAVSDNKNIPSALDSSHLAANPIPTNPPAQVDSSVKTPIPSTSIDTTLKNNSLPTNNANEVIQSPVSPLSSIDSSAKSKDSVIVSNVEEKKDTAATALSNKNETLEEIKDSSSQANNNNTLQINTSNETKGSPTNATQDHPPSNQLIVLPKAVTDSRVNSDCKYFASTEDFLKLRKKMAAEGDMDNMLKIAKKYFKAKCYSTEQIKDLSYLFLSDEGKYKFFDEAYPFASDSDQYQLLQSQFTDNYYLKRFRAMIGK